MTFLLTASLPVTEKAGPMKQLIDRTAQLASLDRQTQEVCCSCIYFLTHLYFFTTYFLLTL